MNCAAALKGEDRMEFRDKPMQNLIRVKEKEICKNVQELLLDGEQIEGAYKTVRDQAVFTSHRIFIVDMPVSYTHLTLPTNREV